jgi:nitrogen regulatory protein PII-like uncharacterized protein
MRLYVLLCEKGDYMVFKYKWCDQKSGNYAIRRKDTKSKPAGQEIELKSRQTSDTHFFIFINEKDDDSMFNRLKINGILKTITYEYIYRGTDKKSLTRYLTKKDIENVIKNIEANKNKTIRIETSPSKLNKTNFNKEAGKILNKTKNFLEDTDSQNYKKIINTLTTNLSKENELIKRRSKAETRIRKLNAEIKAVKNDLLEYETATTAEIETLEKNIFNLLPVEMKRGFKSGSFGFDFQSYLKITLYQLAKKEIRNKKTSVIQKRYRKNKKESKATEKE